jgi:hypothetical protein
MCTLRGVRMLHGTAAAFCQGRGHLKAGRGRREGQRTCDHFCDGGLGEREIVVGGWEARVAFAV